MSHYDPRWLIGALDLTEHPFASLFNGGDYGEPSNTAVVVASLLADGEVLSGFRSGNRTMTHTVYIESSDSLLLAEAERDLFLECEKTANTFTVIPGDGFGESSVYEISRTSGSYVRDDAAEEQGYRRYDLTFSAQPFARPELPTTVALSYGTATSGTVIDDGSSTTNWSVDPDVSGKTLSTVTYLAEAALKCAPATTRPFGSGTLDNDTFTRTSLALTASHPYLAVVVAADAAGGTRNIRDVIVEIGGKGYNPVASEVLANGSRRFFFSHNLAGTTVTAKIVVRWNLGHGAASTQSSYVMGVESWPSAPATGLNVFEVGGSQRAPFSLMVSRSIGGDLGRVGVFSDPKMLTMGYDPSQPATWANAPAGTYTMAMPDGSGTTTVVAITVNGQTAYTRSPSVTAPLFFEFHLGSARNGRLGPLTIAVTVDGAPITTPTLWLFRKADNTALTLLNSVAYRRLWIDAPTLEAPHVGLWGGTAADGSDAVSVATQAYCADPMHIAPDIAALWVSTAAGAAVVDSEVTYYPRSHTFVAAS